MEYVSKIEVNGSQITLTDVMGDRRTVEGTLALADLTGGVVRIDCQE
jgi:predicted RNA-binding protein